jgi:hypothetical protein
MGYSRQTGSPESQFADRTPIGFNDTLEGNRYGLKAAVGLKLILFDLVFGCYLLYFDSSR